MFYSFRYFKRRASKMPVKIKRDEDDDDVSDMESVASEEFEEYLAQGADFDFASDMKAKPKADKKKKKTDDDGEEDKESDEGGAGSDLDAAEMDSDEEDFENDDDFQDAFKDFDDMLNESTAADEELVDGEEVDLGEPLDEEGGFREEDVEFSDGKQFLIVFNEPSTQLY